MVLDVIAVVIPFIMIPLFWRLLIHWATGGEQRRARRVLRQEWRRITKGQ